MNMFFSKNYIYKLDLIRPVSPNNYLDDYLSNDPWVNINIHYKDRLNIM